MKLIAGCGMQPINGQGNVVVDLSFSYLKKNRGRHTSSHHYIQADLRDLPFKGCVFEEIECIDVLEHIPERGAVLKELARVSIGDKARLKISAALKSANRFLGNLSKTYRKHVTLGFHHDCRSGRVYEQMIGRHFTIKKAEYPCSAFPIVVTLLLDPLSVTVEESGEYIGKNRDRLFLWAQFLYPFLQPLCNWLGRRFPESLTQSGYYYCISGPHKGPVPRVIGFHKPLLGHLRSYL